MRKAVGTHPVIERSPDKNIHEQIVHWLMQDRASFMERNHVIALIVTSRLIEKVNANAMIRSK